MVSIIVPAYNTEGNIEVCLHSILEQTYQEWECLVIDDGSTDGTGAICDSLQKKDSRFRVFHQRNMGVSSARNLGIENAKGEFLCFVDSDDCLGTMYVEHLINAIGNADLAVSGIRQYDKRGNSFELYLKENALFSLDSTGESLFVQMNEAELLFPPFVKLYKTCIIREHSITFPEDCSYGEDLQFVYHYLNYVDRIATITNVDYFYLMSEGNSLSTKKRMDAFDEDYKQWEIIRAFHEKKHFSSPESKKFLYHRLFGIIYNALFSLQPTVDLSRIRKILSVPEISLMRPFLRDYQCAGWIKESILCRCSFVFFLYYKIVMRDNEDSRFCSN